MFNPVEALRIRSGSVRSPDRLTSFLYDLMRDHLTPGQVEKLLLDCPWDGEETIYTNGWLALYAQDVADRLTGKIGKTHVNPQ